MAASWQITAFLENFSRRCHMNKADGSATRITIHWSKGRRGECQADGGEPDDQPGHHGDSSTPSN